MRTARCTYECSACGVSVPVEVSGLDDPEPHISESTREILRKTWVLREGAGLDAGPEPVGRFAAELLEGFAGSKLKFATCPRCGARNPEGLADLATDTRWIRAIGVVIGVLLAAATWRWPGLGLGLAGVSFVFGALAVVMAARAGAPATVRGAALGLLAPTALLALAWSWPAAAFVVPLVFTVPAVWSRGDRDAPWRDAARDLRFLKDGP